MIRLEAVTKEFGDGQVAVDHLSLEVPEGDLCVLVGPSGCGKTTTMKMVNRLIEPTSGRIFLEGKDVTHEDPVTLRRRIGYVIQQVGLFPHLTIGDNIGTVPRLLGWDRARIRARTHELLELVGLEPDRYIRRYPHELSGGQRQRVGVARALAADPPVLLMDEPFGAIDPITRARLQGEFIRLQAEVRKTIIFVTHDLEEAVRLGDRIAILAEGGRLEQYDTPGHILGHPASSFVADFVGADRGLKRLSVTPIRDVRLDPPPASGANRGIGAGPGGRGAVPLSGSLRDALVVMLQHDNGTVAVMDGERIAGLLTPESLHQALREDVREVGASDEVSSEDGSSEDGSGEEDAADVREPGVLEADAGR